MSHQSWFMCHGRVVHAMERSRTTYWWLSTNMMFVDMAFTISSALVTSVSLSAQLLVEDTWGQRRAAQTAGCCSRNLSIITKVLIHIMFSLVSLHRVGAALSVKKTMGCTWAPLCGSSSESPRFLWRWVHVFWNKIGWCVLVVRYYRLFNFLQYWVIACEVRSHVCKIGKVLQLLAAKLA